MEIILIIGFCILAFVGGYMAEPMIYQRPLQTLYGSILGCGLIVLMLFSYTNHNINPGSFYCRDVLSSF